MSKPYSDAANIPVNASQPVLTYHPVTLDVPGRPVPLEVKVSIPANGTDLPLILLSHGHGLANFLSSYNGYGPLANFFAAHGFAVVQPTHLDSTALGLRDADLKDAPLFWRDRATDMHTILDRLDEIEAAVPGLAERRIDRDLSAPWGTPWAATPSPSSSEPGMLDPDDDRPKDLSDSRVKAGVLIGAPGIGNDEHFAEWAKTNYPVLYYTDFEQMTGTGLIIVGDQDLNPNFSNRLSYRADAYSASPGGNKTMVTMYGAGHIFGGISGYDAAETDDENPERVATLRALVWAYLRSQLYSGDSSWKNAVNALENGEDPMAMVETR